MYYYMSYHNYVTTYSCFDAAVNFPAMYFSFKEIHFNSELFRTKGTRQYRNSETVSQNEEPSKSHRFMFDSSGKHVTTLEILTLTSRFSNSIMKLMTCSLHVRLPKRGIFTSTGPLKSSQSRTGKKSRTTLALREEI